MVLFLCTGNYYRSRYAEEVFNFRPRQMALNWRAFSRGAAERGSPNNVGPISPYALDALHAKGIAPDGASRVPLACKPEDFDNANLVIAVNEVEHRPLIERRFPKNAGRVLYWAVDDIEFLDPITALGTIDDHVQGLFT
jgi:protein-tyrosine phosphatase